MKGNTLAAPGRSDNDIEFGIPPNLFVDPQ